MDISAPFPLDVIKNGTRSWLTDLERGAASF
jgi:hypothetical protein